MRKAIICLFALGCLTALSSCKKDQSSTTTPSLGGIMMSEYAPPYVAIGEPLVFKADVSSIYTSDSKDPGVVALYWQVNSAKKDTLSHNIKLENPEFTYKADSLNSYTVYCYAYAVNGGHTTTSVSSTFECINPETALTGMHEYLTVNIEGKEWTAFNIFTTESGATYKNAAVTTELFGKYYTWEEASAACPEGWHLPTAAEWDSLGEDVSFLMAPAIFLKKKMWTPALGQDTNNLYGFNAIPTGYMDKTATVSKFRRYGEYAMFWTATENPQDATQAQYRYICYNNPLMQKGHGDKKSLAMSVRCVAN